MAKKKNKTGLMVILLSGGIIIGVIAAILVMTMLNKKTGTETKETSQIIETQAQTETKEESVDPSTPDDPVPTEEMNIAVIKVNDQTVTMREVNVYLYQLRDFYTSQYGESPWNRDMEDGTKLHEYAKVQLHEGLVRTEIINSKAGDYGVSLTDEEKQSLKTYMGPYTLTYGTDETEKISDLYYGDSLNLHLPKYISLPLT